MPAEGEGAVAGKCARPREDVPAFARELEELRSVDDLFALYRLCGGDAERVVELLARLWGASAEAIAMEGFVVGGGEDGVAVPRAHEDKAAEGHEHVFDRESERRALQSKLGDGVGRGGVP